MDPEIPGGPWLHYHTEIFTVPRDAAEIARSPAGPAAFRIGPHLGLQFHPEADAQMAEVWAAKDPDQTDALARRARRVGRALGPTGPGPRRDAVRRLVGAGERSVAAFGAERVSA